MTITLLEDGWISDSFTLGKSPLLYSDALVMIKEEYDALTEEQIQNLKQQRYDNWINFINNPPPTPEEFIEE